ncbi:MAG: PEP-CTERM sorting domain-containing protein, partial [Phycisphaerales bacterium]|nr:PEP-CTERM sorting domain-containing protein [Phycisphaerales bacterium]
GSAQEFSLSLAGAPSTIDSVGGAVITIDVIVDASVGTHILGADFGLSSGGNSMIENIIWTPATWVNLGGGDGYIGSGEYQHVSAAQWMSCTRPPQLCWDPGEGSELGGVIGSFQVFLVAGSFGSLDLEVLESVVAPSTVEVFEWDDSQEYGFLSDLWNNASGNLTLTGTSINVVPAPSSLALLGLGGLAASRRRR